MPGNLPDDVTDAMIDDHFQEDDQCLECENGLVYFDDRDEWFPCDACKGTGLVRPPERGYDEGER